MEDQVSAAGKAPRLGDQDVLGLGVAATVSGASFCWVRPAPIVGGRHEGVWVVDRQQKVQKLVEQLALEVLDFIKVSESLYPDRWVPAAEIKRKLGLNLVAVPVANDPQRGEKGWFFASLARLLEDRGLLDYKKDASRRAFYRSR